MSTYQIRIAIADDHTLVRNGIISILNDFHDFNVVADAENGKSLISKIADLDLAPDICILDINMPELDGYGTISKLKKIYPSLKFLVLTVCDNMYSIVKMIKAGANGYLLKQGSPSDLQKALKNIYENGFHYSNFVSAKAFKVVRENYFPELTEKEIHFLRLCCSEQSYAKIAEAMYVSQRTVEGYQKSIGEKLNIHTRVGLVLFAIQSGFISLNAHPVK